LRCQVDKFNCNVRVEATYTEHCSLFIDRMESVARVSCRSWILKPAAESKPLTDHKCNWCEA
jgi:hypothetical protein